MSENELIVKHEIDSNDLFVNGGMDALLKKIETDAKALVEGLSVDVASERKQIISVAYKISKSSTVLEEMKKELTSEWKRKAKVVDAEGKRAKDFLSELKEKIRSPVTEFENKEKQRVQDHEDSLEFIRELAAIDHIDTISLKELEDRLKWNDSIERNWEEFEDQALTLIQEGHEKLFDLIERRKKYEAEQAELQKLREEQAAREKKEHEERIAREAAEKARREAEEAAKREHEKIEREKIQAEERAKQAERERIAAEERAKAEKERAVKEAEEKARLEAEEKERQRIAEETARIEKEKKEQQERERLAANKRHRDSVRKKATDSFTRNGFDQLIADRIVELIESGEIENVTINF